MSHAVARNIILDGTGTHFDSDVVEAFLESEPEIRAIARRCNTDFGHQTPTEDPLAGCGDSTAPDAKPACDPIGGLA
jgi:putative two-component system response regulator